MENMRIITVSGNWQPSNQNYKMKFLSTFTLLCFLLLLVSCRRYKCEEPLDIKESKLLIGFKNTAGEYLHSESNPLYHKDSLKVFDEAGHRYFPAQQLAAIPNSALRYWKFDFGPIYNLELDSEAFSREVCKKYIIKYTYADTDTITTCFQAFKTKCGSEFSTLKIYHKGLLLNEKRNTIMLDATITKN